MLMGRAAYLFLICYKGPLTRAFDTVVVDSQTLITY
jgi:hypothetical protein